MIAAHPRQFDEQGLASRFEPLGAALGNIVQVDRARLDGFKQPLLPFLDGLDLAVQLVDSPLLIVF
ncbi:MAG TPA: hypothetical protein VMV91_03060 [Rhodocyclaceae bacterium]|nr:hypothetical protein [Rhodocyclaceae bacterium]